MNKKLKSYTRKITPGVDLNLDLMRTCLLMDIPISNSKVLTSFYDKLANCSFPIVHRQNFQSIILWFL